MSCQTLAVQLSKNHSAFLSLGVSLVQGGSPEPPSLPHTAFVRTK